MVAKRVKLTVAAASARREEEGSRSLRSRRTRNCEQKNPEIPAPETQV